MNTQTQNAVSDLLFALAENRFTFIRILPNDKRPEGKWSRPEDRIEPSEVISRLEKGSNYGIVPPDGVFILDFDSDEAYRRSIEKSPVIQESLTFKTPRGYHVVFQGEGVGQGASHTFLGQGVDVRAGSKGYVVGPGSMREDGRYEYLHGDEILEAPETLRNLLQKPVSKPTAEVLGDQAPSARTAPQSAVAASTGTQEGQRSLTVMERAGIARKHWKALETAQEGERNDTLARTACGLGSIYADAETEKRNEIYAKLMEHAERLGEGDAAEIQQNRTTAENQWNKGAESPASRPDGSEAREMYRLVFEKFDIHEGGKALANLNIEIRDNQETDKVEFKIIDDGSWAIPQGFRFQIGEWFVSDKKTNNAIIGNITRYFGRQRGESVVSVSLSNEKFKQWIDTFAGENPVRPFRDWVERCRLDPNLEGLTLDNWLNPWLANRESPLVQWTSRAIMVGIVQKIYKDPQACRIIPVLRGDQNIGKTTMVTELIPEEYRNMFGQFQVNSRKAEMVGALRGKFLCEAGELAGMNDSRVSIFKAFIGNAINTARLTWEPEYLDYENTAFIIGTTNPERNVPNDDALRSRLVFIDLQKGPDPKDYLPDRLGHLYALARDAHKAGQRVGVIPANLEPEQMEASEDSIIVNEVMDNKLRSADLRSLGRWFTLNEFMQCSGIISLWNVKAPPGAEKATRDYLSKELGVSIHRKDMRMKTKDGKRNWCYQESDRIREIRKHQVKTKGAYSSL